MNENLMGTHLLLNMYGVSTKKITNENNVRRGLELIIKKVNLHSLGMMTHQFMRNNQPHGVSGIVLLSESHLSIHTWPEFSSLASDVYTCGKEGDAHLAAAELLKYFTPEKYSLRQINR